MFILPVALACVTLRHPSQAKPAATDRSTMPRHHRHPSGNMLRGPHPRPLSRRAGRGEPETQSVSTRFFTAVCCRHSAVSSDTADGILLRQSTPDLHRPAR
jgi:hypothetical protein